MEMKWKEMYDGRGQALPQGDAWRTEHVQLKNCLLRVFVDVAQPSAAAAAGVWDFVDTLWSLSWAVRCGWQRSNHLLPEQRQLVVRGVAPHHPLLRQLVNLSADLLDLRGHTTCGPWTRSLMLPLVLLLLYSIWHKLRRQRSGSMYQ